MKFKNLLVFVLSASMFTAMAFGFSACGNTESGNQTEEESSLVKFDGTISETSYESKEAAAEGFLSEQIDGDATTTQFVSYETEKVLSDDEIASLGLSESDAAGVTAAEKGSVTYIDDETEMTASVYMLTFTDIIKYFTTGEYEVGDVLTQADYEALIHSDALTNVTVTGTYSQTAGTYSSATEIKIYCSADALLYTEIYTDGYGVEGLYISNESGGVSFYTGTISNGNVSDLSLYQTYTDYTIANALEDCLFSAQGDHTYLELGENGFVLREEKRQNYFDDFLTKYGLDNVGYELVDCNCEFVMESNNIVKMIHYSYGKTDDGSEVIQNVEFIFSDYGTTQFDVPEIS